MRNVSRFKLFLALMGVRRLTLGERVTVARYHAAAMAKKSWKCVRAYAKRAREHRFGHTLAKFARTIRKNANFPIKVEIR